MISFRYSLQTEIFMDLERIESVHVCISLCHQQQNNGRSVSYFLVPKALAEEHPSEFKRFTSAKPNTYRHSYPWLDEKHFFLIK